MIGKWLLRAGSAGVVIIVVLLITITLRWDRRFDVPYPRLSASTDPALIARGRYLAYGPAHCSDCHVAPADYQTLKAGAQPPLSGGGAFKIPPGTIRVPNLTPDSATGIGGVSDSALARVLRYGVRPDGRATIPFMEFRDMSDADLAAILSFLRAQKPVRNVVSDHALNLLGKTVMAFMIKPLAPSAPPAADSPPQGPTLERGAYLVTAVANCAGCHTTRSMVTGAYTGPRLAGGFEMETGGTPSIKVVPPNIRGDSAGRAGMWTEAEFLARFHAGERIPGSPMPWQAFQRMSDDDVRAIYRYLRTVKS
jgi:mono/diheme cytochrome c family protein